MESNVILWILGVVAVMAFVAVLAIQNFKKKLIPTVSKLKGNPVLFSDTETGTNLNEFIRALNDSGENSSGILANLKTNPRGCSEELTAAFAKLPEDAYNTKWLLVYTITQFELPEFTGLLNEIAGREIPNEKSKNIHLFSTVAEETSIRLRAIEGLKLIAKKDDKESQAALFELLKSKYLTLAIAACQSLIEVNSENKTKIAEILPKEKRFIIDIQRTDISEIPFLKMPEQSMESYLPKPGQGEKYPEDLSRIISSSRPPKTNDK